MQTVCLCDKHSQELLADKGYRHPLCFALEVARHHSNQSSKLVAALRCEAGTNCLPAIPFFDSRGG